MSATVIYAALLVIVMSLMTGCSQRSKAPKSQRARVVCRSSTAGKRAASWNPPRHRL